MSVRDLPTNDTVRRDALKDPEFRAQWERTALARAVAMQVVHYRAHQGLTQTALARTLGMHQSAIARLEAGEHNPSIEMLQRLARALGIEFHIQIDITAETVELSA